MATSKLMLNKARRLNDGTYPLVVQLLHRRKKRVIYLGLYLHPEEFDEQAKQAVPSHLHYRRQKDIKARGREISEFVERLSGVIAQLEWDGIPYTCDRIVELFHMNNTNASLVNFWQNKISEHRKAGKFGIANAQQQTLRSVVRFAGTDQISIGSVTPEFIRDYQRYQQDRSLTPNTICYYMRNLKTIINSIAKDGFLEQATIVLFAGIKTTPRKTIKRAISRDELRRFSQMNFEGEPLLQFTRDLFMFSFYTRGMAFVDIAFLTRENLVGETLSYSRKKTGQRLHISINEHIKLLLSRYLSTSQYLFPIVFSDNNETAYLEYRSSLRRINHALKSIGARAGFDTPLTTYVARHSWATQAKEQGFPIAVISEGLGHCSEVTTQIYLKEFDRSVLDKANDVITNL